MSSYIDTLFRVAGSSKKGNNHIVHSVKHIKLTGSITCIQKSQNSKHLAIGSDQGHVSLVDVEEATVLYTKHIASDICPGITSLQFESCSVQGFEKNVLVVAMRDSSVFSLDSDTGNMIGTNMVKPKKPFKALFMQILGRFSPLFQVSKQKKIKILNDSYQMQMENKTLQEMERA